MTDRPKTYYVGHFITKPFRRTLMVILWISFFLISPSIILYTAGYRYDWKNNVVKQTGVLSVDVLPRDSIVTLNGIRVEKQIPIRLTNRAPGTYLLTIERPGYKTWQRDIVIESNNTTYIKNITLVKDSLPIRITDSIDTVIGIYGSGYSDVLLVLKKTNNLYELEAFNPTTNATTLVYRSENATMPMVEVSPYTSLAYSRIKGNTSDTLYLISLNGPENTTINSIPTTARLTWNATNGTEQLYKNDAGRITSLSTTRGEQTIGTVSSSVWYRDDQGGIWTANSKTITNPYTSKIYLLPDEIDSIVHVNEARIIATHKDRTIVAKLKNNDIESIQTINGTRTHYNRRTQEWLVWSPWELSSVYVDGGVTLLNRSGEKIKEVTLLDESGVILLATEGDLSAFNPGYYVRHSLISISEYTFVSANIAKRTLYFFGSFAGKNGLYALEY